MATRTFVLTNTLTDPSPAPIVGLGVPITLIVPGGGPAVDIDTQTVIPDVLTPVTNSAGTYSQTLIYPGDITPAGCVYSVQEGANTVLSPVSFSYVSSIATWQWYGAGGSAGTLQSVLTVVLANDAPVSGRSIHITPQQNAVAPDTTLLSVSSPVNVLLDGTGTATCWLWPSSSLSPVTLYTCRIDGELTKLSFSVPSAITGYQGAYNSGTTYHVNGNTAASPSDVVLLSGIYYQCVLNTLGNAPPNATYWIVWAGEKILWHLQPFGVGQCIPISPANIGNDAGLQAPAPGDPWPTSTSLAQDLENIQTEERRAGVAAALYLSTHYS